MSDSDPTAERFEVPWSGVPLEGDEERFAHLVVAAMYPEVERVGQSACIDRPCFFGRGEPKELPRVELTEQRPGTKRGMAPVDHPALSRQQLVFEPLSDGRVRVENTGNLELYHNG